MRSPRITAPADQPAGVYHCFSRIVDRQPIFGPAEKEHFAALLREYEAFCRVRILTFAIMSNHFHVLVQVPRRPDPGGLPGPEEIVHDLRALSGHQDPNGVAQRFEALRRAGDAQALADDLAAFHARMYDLSNFIKEVKQRFSQWFNKRAGRTGTLWSDRFHSVLVEGEGHVLTRMAAYIDLNPLRAGLVTDPKDYRWCGYGEAVGGRQGARAGIQAVVRALQRGREEEEGKSLEVYRMHLYLEGEEGRESLGEDGRPARGALTREAMVEVLKAKGRLSMGQYLRCRVRYFCDGAVLGGEEFVEGIFRAHRKRFGPRRKTGARRMRGLADVALYTLRDLQRDVFG